MDSSFCLLKNLNLLKFIDRMLWVSFEGAEPVCIKINETPLKVLDVKIIPKTYKIEFKNVVLKFLFAFLF